MSQVAYVAIGNRTTRVTWCSSSTTTFHYQQTPHDVRQAKRRIYRYYSEEGHIVVLDRFLRCLWDSHNLHLAEHIVLVPDLTDTNEFVAHVLRWLWKCIHRGGTVVVLSFPLFAAGLHGVGSNAVVIDVGYELCRIVPILHRMVVREFLFCSVGVGGCTVDREHLVADGFLSSWSASLERLMDDYLRLKIILDEPPEGEARTVLESAQEYMSSVVAQEPKGSIAFIEHFCRGLEEGIVGVIDSSRDKGMLEVSSTWIVTGAGARIPSVKNFIGYILSVSTPDSVVVWA